MRLRKVQGKLKVEHAILDGVRIFSRSCSAENPSIRSVIPGVIRPVRDAKGPAKIRVTVPTTNGWKAIALSDGARQELFISTALTREELEQAIRHACRGRTVNRRAGVFSRADARDRLSCHRSPGGALGHASKPAGRSQSRSQPF